MQRTLSISFLLAALALPAIGQYPPLVAYDLHVGTNYSEMTGVTAQDQVGRTGNMSFRWTGPFSAPWTSGPGSFSWFMNTDGIQVAGSQNGRAGFWVFNGNPYFQPLPIVKFRPYDFALDSYGSRFVGFASKTTDFAVTAAILWPSYNGR